MNINTLANRATFTINCILQIAMNILLLLHIIITFTKVPQLVYITFVYEFLNSVSPLFYLFYSEDNATFEMTASSLFIALVIASIPISYTICFFLKKPVNNMVDYAVFYVITAIIIATKTYIFTQQCKSGKDDQLDYSINMFGIAIEVWGLCQDILLSRWLIGKLVNAMEYQTLVPSTARSESKAYFTPCPSTLT